MTELEAKLEAATNEFIHTASLQSYKELERLKSIAAHSKGRSKSN